MAKKKEKKKEMELPIFIFTPPPPQVHPNEDQEDPVNGKFEKTIEITPFGPEWR